MTEILPAHAPEIADGSVFVPFDADVAAIVAAAGDRVREIVARPGYGYDVPADIAKTAGVAAVKTVNADDVPAPEPEPADEAPAKGSK